MRSLGMALTSLIFVWGVTRKKEALALIIVDEEVSLEVLEELKKHSCVLKRSLCGYLR